MSQEPKNTEANGITVNGDNVVVSGNLVVNGTVKVNGLNTYTAFCQDAWNKGTIWIDVVYAESLETALVLAASACAHDWDCDADDVHVLGIAEGDVNILHWEDL